jgi:hypothetical protein
MFRFTIRDVMWLMVVVGLGFILLALAQSSSLATMEGNAFSLIVCMGMLAAITRIVRNAQSRR